MSDTPRDVRDDRLLEALGVPYSWGAGALADGLSAWPDGSRGKYGGIGWDCSGFAQLALLRLGLIAPDAWGDVPASILMQRCVLVVEADIAPGDLVFYRNRRGEVGHVMVVYQIAYDGRAPLVIGASGGGSRTNADDPTACVQIRPMYYRDPHFIGRLREEYR